MKKNLFNLFFVLIISHLISCNQPPSESIIKIGIAGKSDQLNRMDEALDRMAEPYTLIDSISTESLANIDLLILPKGAFANNSAGVRSRNDVVTEWVMKGGALLTFSISDKEYTTDLLPYEIRFAVKDPTVYGNYDFSEQIADTSHTIFNTPHRLRYLAGLEESYRIEFTAPEWNILLAKNGDHPGFDYKLNNPPNDVGSLFESPLGKGHILVCQPIIERYYAENAEIAPHPLEGGVKLFENVIEYMKGQAAKKDLPVAKLEAIPSHAPTGKKISFRATLVNGENPVTCHWDFGDGTEGQGVVSNHTYSKPGIYWAKSTVTIQEGDVDHAACRVVVGESREYRWADHMIDALKHRYYPDPGRIGPNYRTALVMTGLLDVYDRTRDTGLLEYIQGFYQGRLIDRWENRPYKGDKETGGDFVDLYSLMSPAWRVFKITGDSMYLQMAHEVWTQSLTNDHSLPQDLFWSPWVWGGRRAIVDFTYFKSQLRGMAWEDNNDPALLDESATQMLRFTEHFQDPSDSLFFMAIDLDRKEYFTSPERPSGLNDSKWNRANGWIALAFTELMTRLDRNHPKWGELEDIVKQFFTGIIHAQDPETGLWALVIDQRDYPGMWLETTGSSMFVYSICKLVEMGILPADPYLACARRGYNGLQQRIGLGYQDYPYLSDACQGTAPRLNLGRWIQSHRRDNDFHVFGPFLSAEEALWRTAPPEIAVVGDLKSSENRIGELLNMGGYFFFSIPELYNSPELNQFQTLVIERNAIDRNHANIAAYPEKLVAFVQQGGTLFIMPQENEEWLEQKFPELKSNLKTMNDKAIVEIQYDQGRVVYCKKYPELKPDMGESKRVAVLRTFVNSYMQDI